MKIFRAKFSFEARTDCIANYPISGQVIYEGQVFICSSPVDLPQPVVGNVLAHYEEIVPKNVLINLSSFVKAKSL